ncbi:MAG: flavoprotein [Verrucomicrobiae bacterium]|nr:flavoprotein [Verrucomicrobiae bacterium]
MPHKPARIVLGLTGSIAAYKAADLCSRLRQAGHDVHCVMTADAQKFITPLTLQTLSRNPVLTSLHEETSWQPGHIALADSADLVVVAPATANLIAKAAHGMADDALTCILLATRAPIVMAPAMNGKMWLHPATRENVATLTQRKVRFIGPEKGLLACGYEGIGRLWNIDDLAQKIQKLCAGRPA